MKSRTEIIEEIVAILQQAEWNVLEFVYGFLKPKRKEKDHV